MVLTFTLKIEETTLMETIVIYKNLWWYNLDYHHPKMVYDDGEPYIMGLLNFVMRFTEKVANNQHASKQKTNL